MRLFAAFLTALLIAPSVATAGGDEPPSLRGQVVDASRGALPGTTVTLTPNSTPAAETRFQITDESGVFTFAGVPAGSYSVTFSMPGFDDKTISAVVLPTSETLTIELRIGTFEDRVSVVAESANTDARAAAGQSDIQEDVLSSMPLARDRFEDALPLVPGVVRGPDGLLNMKGARSHESSTLVNGLNVSDPVTGHAAVRLPLEAVETLKVHTGVYSAAFGNATGGVTDVVTRPGTDNFAVQVQNFFPRLRIKEGSVKGFDAFTPRVRIAGPIRQVVTSLNRNLPVLTSQTLEEAMAFTLLPQRIGAFLSGSLGLVGLLLATMGIYGLIAFIVAQRTREIGIRLALGATRAAIVELVVRFGVKVVAGGTALGLLIAIALHAVLTRVFFGFPPIDAMPVKLLGGYSRIMPEASHPILPLASC